MVFCIDCKHCSLSLDPYKYMCNRTYPVYDLVTGILHKKSISNNGCYKQREDRENLEEDYFSSYHCGPEGKFYKPRI